MKSTLLIIFLAIVLSACNSSGDGSVSVNNTGDETEHIIHLNKIKDSLHINLSDIARDFEFITFETSPECIFSDASIYLTMHYILVMKPNHGILQFDREGKFIRTLVKVGEGPEEYSRAYWTIDEESQVLYLSDHQKENYFLQFDLTAGKYLGNLPKAIPGRTKDILFENNSLWVVPSGGGDNNRPAYYLYNQDLSGKVNFASSAPKDFFMSWGSKSLHQGTTGYRYHIPEDDTIYTVTKNDRIPDIIFDFGEKNPPGRNVGHKSMSINIEIGQFVFFYNFEISGIETQAGVTITSGLVENYVLDRENRRACYSGEMFFDPIHTYIDSDHYQFSSYKSNGLLYYAFQAVDLLEHAEKALGNPDFKDPYRSQLQKLVDNLSENDNPVLVIGQL